MTCIYTWNIKSIDSLFFKNTDHTNIMRKCINNEQFLEVSSCDNIELKHNGIKTLLLLPNEKISYCPPPLKLKKCNNYCLQIEGFSCCSNKGTVEFWIKSKCSKSCKDLIISHNCELKKSQHSFQTNLYFKTECNPRVWFGIYFYNSQRKDKFFISSIKLIDIEQKNICGLDNCICPQDLITLCQICHQANCICNRYNRNNIICSFCGQLNCICNRNNIICSVCGQLNCICNRNNIICSICRRINCICNNNIGFSPEYNCDTDEFGPYTYPYMCIICKQNPCICNNNITLTPYMCIICKQNPCICNNITFSPKYNDYTDDFGPYTKPYMCIICKQNPCICIKPTNLIPYSNNICVICQQNPCICIKPTNYIPNNNNICPQYYPQGINTVCIYGLIICDIKYQISNIDKYLKLYYIQDFPKRYNITITTNPLNTVNGTIFCIGNLYLKWEYNCNKKLGCFIFGSLNSTDTHHTNSTQIKTDLKFPGNTDYTISILNLYSNTGIIKITINEQVEIITQKCINNCENAFITLFSGSHYNILEQYKGNIKDLHLYQVI